MQIFLKSLCKAAGDLCKDVQKNLMMLVVLVLIFLIFLVASICLSLPLLFIILIFKLVTK